MATLLSCVYFPIRKRIITFFNRGSILISPRLKRIGNFIFILRFHLEIEVVSFA